MVGYGNDVCRLIFASGRSLRFLDNCALRAGSQNSGMQYAAKIRELGKPSIGNKGTMLGS